MTPRSIQKNILEVLVYGSSDEIVNAGDSGSLAFPFTDEYFASFL